jgi:hypothetical protein
VGIVVVSNDAGEAGVDSACREFWRAARVKRPAANRKGGGAPVKTGPTAIANKPNSRNRQQGETNAFGNGTGSKRALRIVEANESVGRGHGSMMMRVFL